MIEPDCKHEEVVSTATEYKQRIHYCKKCGWILGAQEVEVKQERLGMREVVVIPHGDTLAAVLYEPKHGRVDLLIEGNKVETSNVTNRDFPKTGSMKNRMKQWGENMLRRRRN